MRLNPPELDFSHAPAGQTSERVLSVAGALFDSVKSAPLDARSKLPKVLRNNDFSLIVLVTRNHVFLEVTTNQRAHPRHQADRLQAYRQLFTHIVDEQAPFAIDKVRLVRVGGGGTIKARHVFALGSDFSMCTWDLTSKAVVSGEEQTRAIDIVYVVGLGDLIPADAASQEFDALIRVTLADWSRAR